MKILNMILLTCIILLSLTGCTHPFGSEHPFGLDPLAVALDHHVLTDKNGCAILVEKGNIGDAVVLYHLPDQDAKTCPLPKDMK